MKLVLILISIPGTKSKFLKYYLSEIFRDSEVTKLDSTYSTWLNSTILDSNSIWIDILKLESHLEVVPTYGKPNRENCWCCDKKKLIGCNFIDMLGMKNGFQLLSRLLLSDRTENTDDVLKCSESKHVQKALD